LPNPRIDITTKIPAVDQITAFKERYAGARDISVCTSDPG
jgi:hypothetical protein